MDPIDKGLCSFSIPEFTSEEEEARWFDTLSFSQRLELLGLSQLARYGAEALRRRMDRSHFEVLTMDEFTRLKDAEDLEEERWRLQHGWSARIPQLRAKLLENHRP